MSDEKKMLEPSEEKKVFETIEIIASEENSRGAFANNFVISFSPEYFQMDFMYMAGNRGTLNARVIVTPSHAKRIVKAMEENLSKYESTFGTIPEAIKEKGTKR